MSAFTYNGVSILLFDFDANLKLKPNSNRLGSLTLLDLGINLEGLTIKEARTIILKKEDDYLLEPTKDELEINDQEYHEYMERCSKIQEIKRILGLNSKNCHFDNGEERFRTENGKIICKNYLRMFELSLGLGLTGSTFDEAKEILEKLEIEVAKKMDNILDGRGPNNIGYRETILKIQKRIRKAKEILGLT